MLQYICTKRTREKKVKIGYRTIKTAVGVPISIMIAQLFGITNAVSAGILTILCIQPSRKRSFRTAWQRFSACIIGTVFSVVLFELLGYSPWVLSLLFILFIPTCVFFDITPGIATSSVIIFNMYSATGLNVDFLFDQFLLIIIGIGTALLLNLYMPSLDKQIKEKQRVLEQNFRIILFEIALYIRDENKTWDGKELIEVDQLLEESLDLVERDKENHFLRNNHLYFDYFRMRSRQFEVLQQMLPLVAKLPQKDEISEKFASLFERLSEHVHPGNTASLFLDELKELRKEFNQLDLPETRDEFETRANLFQMLHELEEYLMLKHKYKKSDVKKRKRRMKT